MTTDAHLLKDDPRLGAWEKYKQTDAYVNTRKWAAHEQHRDGSLWAAFLEGWEAVLRLSATPPLQEPAAPTKAEVTCPTREALARWYFDEHYGYSLTDSFRTSAFGSGQHRDADRTSYEMADRIMALLRDKGAVR
jgi:hypothetical protein